MPFIIPEQFHEKLSITSKSVTSAEICQLTLEFNEWLKSCFPDADMETIVASRAQYVDLILSKLWCQHHLDEYQISLMAVGGYGRAELHPHSDVDILILTQEEIDKAQEDKMCAFITQLWDVKLDIGSSVRSINECIEQGKNDVTIATNLIEMRLVCGNKMLAEQLYPLVLEENFWNSKDFFIAKRDEQINRHDQYHGASYTLEPNLKANPGGLRDIQTIGWVAKRHFQADSLEELVDHGYLTRNEYFELVECQDYLWRMRFALHFVAGRSENRLLFDYQADVAKMMGFGDQGKAVVERMMKRFFRIIARVNELNRMLLQHFEKEIINKDVPAVEIKIDDDFVISDGLLKTTDKQIFLRPTKLMEVFLIIAEREEIKGFHSETLRLLRNTRRRLVSCLNDYDGCRQIFMKIMRHPRGLGLAFSLMHRQSILSAYLPEWRQIVGQMQFDLFHAYSVDEHSYRLIKNLYRFSLPKYNHQFPQCSKIVQRMRKPEMLYIAGIFHDIAKGRGGDHAILGAEDALVFAKMHNLSDHDGRRISWLVRHHLTMSVTAQRKDISDEQVIKEFAEIVRDEDSLDSLYCLTVADMRATNESLWNSWKANLLEELYNATKRALRRGLEKPVDLRSKIRENQQLAIEALQANNISKEQLKPLWQHLKADYFLRYTPEQIAWHADHILAKLAKGDHSSIVLISPKPYRGGTEVFIYTEDKKNLFAYTAAFLGARKLSIHDAKIITSKNGYTLNTFVVLDHQNKAINDAARASEIAASLAMAIDNNAFNNIKTQPISKRLRQFERPIEVNFGKTNSQKRTLLQITAIDRPGLLASIGQVFNDCNIHIHSAKITTFGERAEDVFTVSNSEYQYLTEQEQQLLAQRLSAEID
ncbi:[protein-PII] uridylyltransferase [Thalassotalea agariperforans]